MSCIDCNKLKGRQNEICTGFDASGVEIDMSAQKRLKYLSIWFPGISEEAIINHIRDQKIDNLPTVDVSFKNDQVKYKTYTKTKQCTSCGQRTQNVGSILRTKIEKIVKIKPTAGCNCGNLANEMDKWGISGCIANRDKIIDQLVHNKDMLISALRESSDNSIMQKISGLALDILPDIIVLPVLRYGAGILVDSAISEAQNAVLNTKRGKQVRVKSNKVRVRTLNSTQISLHAKAVSRKPTAKDPFTGEPIIHFGAHLWPIKGAWDKHLNLWLELSEKINGRCIIGVGVDEMTDSFEYVKSKFPNRFELIELRNTPEGENPTYRDFIKNLPSGNNDVLIYCHAKGVRSHTRSSEAVKIWTEHMYETVVFNYEKAIEKLAEGYKCFGSYRTFADIPLSPKYRWHYSGTFFIVRAKYLKNTIVKNGYGGVEGWPGNYIAGHDSYCEFLDSAPLLIGYDLEAMYPKVVDEQMQWEVNRLGGPRCEQHKRELEWFYQYIKNGDRILIIGSKHGGLEYQIKKSFHNVKTVSCDISPQQDNCEFVIVGDSSNSDIQREILKNGPYDVIFIDGDHSYDGVKRDWEFAQKIKSARIIAFHDIANTIKHRSEGCEVDRLWGEIKATNSTSEKIVGCGWGGIGVVIL